MADNSAIEWTEATWNPVTGCEEVSPGCAHCYAETFAERWRGIPGHPYEQGFALKLWPQRLEQPLKWSRPRMIFVNSMSDLFHERIPEPGKRSRRQRPLASRTVRGGVPSQARPMVICSTDPAGSRRRRDLWPMTGWVGTPTIDPGGRRVVFDAGSHLHLAAKRPWLLDEIDTILDTVAHPDLHVLDPEGDRERYYRENPFPDGWLRVVVDYGEEPAWIVTAVVQDNDPRG